MRKESLTGDVYQLRDDGSIMHLPTKRGKRSTRLRWTALSADLRTRYCSAYSKIDVFRKSLNNDPRFMATMDRPLKLLVISGGRREESSARAQYNEVEIHSCNNPFRTVHAWRPVIDWKEEHIWGLYEKHRLLPHYAYLLGWNRTSCFGCIFSTADLWAMMREIALERLNLFVQRKREIGHTIDPRYSLEQKANLGSLRRLPKDKRLSQWVQMALSRTTLEPRDLIMEKWELPAGAFRGASGGSI